jgi:hypothetical protein
MLKNFKQFISSLIKENKSDTFEYGCAMVYFDFPEMQNLHGQIDQADIYTEEGDRSYGLEDEPHTTLLFGLHSNEIDDETVMSICKSRPIGELTLSNPSLFENKDYDVLKFDVENPVILEINADLSKLPHTTNFPDYHPHATIGYLKKGMGQKYVDLFSSQEYKVMPSSIVYSKPDGSRIEEEWN